MTARPLRLFVALYPPEDSRRTMREALDAVSSTFATKHRPTPADQVHMTLQFIGDTDERNLADVAESVRRSASGLGKFSLTPMRLITLPEKGPPRLIALETDAPPPLLEVHRRLASRLARNPRAKSADRFLPHLTLCRFAGDDRPPRIGQAVALSSFEVHFIFLMGSILKPKGAQHVPVEEVPL